MTGVSVPLRRPYRRQHGFELPLYPFKGAAQLSDDGTVRQLRTVHVVGYVWYSKPPLVVFSAPTRSPRQKALIASDASHAATL